MTITGKTINNLKGSLRTNCAVAGKSKTILFPSSPFHTGGDQLIHLAKVDLMASYEGLM